MNIKNSDESLIQSILEQTPPLEAKKVRDKMRQAACLYDHIAAKGLTKTTFAKLVDKERSVITKWLSGTHNFTTETLSEISYALDIPLWEMFREKTKQVVSVQSFHRTGVVAYRGAMYGGGAIIPSPQPSVWEQGSIHLSSRLPEVLPDQGLHFQTIGTGLCSLYHPNFMVVAEKRITKQEKKCPYA